MHDKPFEKEILQEEVLKLFLKNKLSFQQHFFIQVWNPQDGFFNPPPQVHSNSEIQVPFR